MLSDKRMEETPTIPEEVHQMLTMEGYGLSFCVL